mgnify:FL=1
MYLLANGIDKCIKPIFNRPKGAILDCASFLSQQQDGEQKAYVLD